MKEHISFIIPSYNSSATIGFTIESILKQKNSEQIKEIFIVDSSDDSQTRNMLKWAEGDKIIKIYMETRITPAKARNLGAKHATGNILCFVDSDVFLEQDWLEKMIDVYKKGYKVASGSIGAPDFQKYEKIAGAQLYLQFNEYLSSFRPGTRTLIPSCNMMCERDLFWQIQGFPELRASEDTVFCLKLSGIAKIWFEPEAKCRHIFRTEKHKFLKNQELLGKYVSIYRRIYSKRLIYRGVFPLLLFPGFFLVKILRISARISGSGRFHLKQFFASFAQFCQGLLFWSIGFIKGCFEYGNSER